MTEDLIKQAVRFVRQQVPEARSSHAHAVVAHALGYNSKKALMDDLAIDFADVNLLTQHELDVKKVKEGVAAMKATPFKSVDAEFLVEIVRAGLAPVCECCREKSLSITPLGFEETEPEGWVCLDCADKNEAYAQCNYCGPDVWYRQDQVNYHGECQEHDGESVLEPEEEADWASYIEYHTKDQC